MIKHIVLMKLKDEAEGGYKSDNYHKLRDMLIELPAKIPEIREYEIGINYSGSPNAMDMSLISAFDDNNALDRYRHNKDHKKVLDYIGKVVDEIRVVDYEV